MEARHAGVRGEIALLFAGFPYRFSLLSRTNMNPTACALTLFGRSITETDLLFLRQLIAEHPQASRRRLSALVCEAWNWRQPSGRLRDMLCRSLMLALHRRDLIGLPPPRHSMVNNVVVRRKPKPVEVDETPVSCSLKDLKTLEFQIVERGEREEKLFDWLLEKHHYLGSTRLIGEKLKYLVWAGERPIACFGWCSAARRLAPRDRFLGWSKDARARNVHLLAYNTRFLIPPWVKVPHLASHLLSRMARRLSKDWQERYGHPVHYLETFVDCERFRGTCYRAANWTPLGRTTGRGHKDLTHQQNRPFKEVLGYALRRDFREQLSGSEA